MYLSAVTSGRAADATSAMAERQRGALAPVRALLRLLGVEAILLWVAVLTKRRVLVYGADVDAVQDAVRSAGLLGAWHRASFDFLRPLTTLSDEEVADLRTATAYVAGTVDPQAAHRRDLYDLAVDRPPAPHCDVDHRTTHCVDVERARTDSPARCATAQ